ncbi:hypothetical protein [Urechidicola croceus]|uniref:Uncharacterized protein n=1 Tax=Urechidicola croceus TaxID=1850246 RepID=A0A1D8P6Y3_9FLAO|nr:hypothetical protein [Urechidicola croceus]AOW20330.1 hypothetical protein LPB138_06395 [Urechidicola croceus]
MEKFFSIKLIFTVVVILSSMYSYSQKSFFVYNVEGSPIFKVNDSIKPINKGTKIDTKSSLTISKTDTILIINGLGELFKISKEGNYLFKDLEKLKSEKNNSSFTKKYFNYIWNQFTNNTKNNTQTGVVYRTDNLTLMLKPLDSIKIHFPEIKFVWNMNPLENKELYFILLENETNHVTKIGTTNNTITLFIDNHILHRGKTYKWTVSETKYPDLESIEFYNFELLDNDTFKSMQLEIGEITSDLEKLGFQTEMIKRMICEDYKVCF